MSEENKPVVIYNLTLGRKHIPKGCTYVGRPSKWGNPHPVNYFGYNLRAVHRFIHWLVDQPQLISQARVELKGASLLCFCVPAPCHAQVWKRVANCSDAELISLVERVRKYKAVVKARRQRLTYKDRR